MSVVLRRHSKVKQTTEIKDINSFTSVPKYIGNLAELRPLRFKNMNIYRYCQYYGRIMFPVQAFSQRGNAISFRSPM